MVWVVALIGLRFGSQWNVAETEPYLQLASGILIIGVAVWMMLSTRRHSHGAAHEHGHNHEHSHGDSKKINTGHGNLRLEIFETGVPPRFRISQDGSHRQDLASMAITLETERPDGQRQTFSFVRRDDFF